jgi:hypothetical protein
LYEKLLFIVSFGFDGLPTKQQSKARRNQTRQPRSGADSRNSQNARTAPPQLAGTQDGNGQLESVQLHLENEKGECMGSPKIPSRGLTYPQATQLWFIDEKHKVDETLKKIPCKN